MQPSQTSIEEANVVEYLPVGSVQNRAPLDFDIPGTGNHYIDTENVMLYVCTKIMQAFDGNLAADATVAPINLMLHSMFSQVDLFQRNADFQFDKHVPVQGNVQNNAAELWNGCQEITVEQ